MVIRRLIDAAHDRLGDCLDALTADPEADERTEDARHKRLEDR